MVDLVYVGVCIYIYIYIYMHIYIYIYTYNHFNNLHFRNSLETKKHTWHGKREIMYLC